MRVSVDADDPTPPYEQIRGQVARLIEAGRLAPGDRLPTVRQLAGDLRVAPGTVARAYKELEMAGLVETRRAAGTRVAQRPVLTSSQRARRLAKVMSDAVETARSLGCAEEEIAKAWATALGRR
ncbi:GntR family transcriptional regulator [Intrasporangium chromatireducens Q5-1]|uniref:GntR family transcriptional regulator n=1 Tax=Intrasporangium chromatireducens Q5-1 TaxID=584657 RepID=W9GN28_9MICO|nr:GntR family transcriptional regulator [Intrasporangium chromatireducens]EWT07490.1 GntR family transcriptional regulator [Intrasporangium chromatireducens Q5-1]